MRIRPFLAIAGLMILPAVAQDLVFEQPKNAPPMVPVPKPKPPTVEGIVTEIFKLKKPWQLLNPNAPKDYGDGRKNVTYSDKDPGKPKGFIVFAIDW